MLPIVRQSARKSMVMMPSASPSRSIFARTSPRYQQEAPIGNNATKPSQTPGSSNPSEASHSAPKSPIPNAPQEKSGGSFFLTIVGTAAVFSGAYVGGLYASEKYPEVAKIYDEYLPYTEEVKKLVGLIPADSSNPKSSFDIFSSKPKPAPSPKPAPAATPKAHEKEEKKVDNSPEKPAEKPAEKVVEKPVEKPVEHHIEKPTEKVAEKQQAPEKEDTKTVQTPEKDKTFNIVITPETNSSKQTSTGVSEAESKVSSLVNELEQLNKSIEHNNQAHVSEVLERSRKNLQDADSTIKELQAEIGKLLEKTDSVLTATITAEIQGEIGKLKEKLQTLNQEKIQTEQHFHAEVQKLRTQLQQETQAKMSELQTKHQQELQELAARHDRDLAMQYRTQENMYNLKVKEQLQKQEETLEALFKEELENTVTKERVERLGLIQRIDKQLAELEEVSKKQYTNEEANQTVRHVLVALKSVEEAIQSREPFVAQVELLKAVAQKHFPLVVTAFQDLPSHVTTGGVLTPGDLASKFYKLRPIIEETAYVTPEGGLWSIMISWVLSKITFSNADGNEVISILNRAESKIKFGDVEGAAREMNQLKGWQKKLSHDWMVAARDYLEVQQAFTLAEAEVAHQILNI